MPDAGAVTGRRAGRKRNPARSHAALVDRAQSLRDRRGGRKLDRQTADEAPAPPGVDGPRGSGLAGCKLRSNDAERPAAARRLAGSRLLAGGDRHVACASACASAASGQFDRFLLERRELLPPSDEVAAAPDELGPRRGSGLLEPSGPRSSSADKRAVRARIAGRVESSSIRTFTSSSAPPPGRQSQAAAGAAPSRQDPRAANEPAAAAPRAGGGAWRHKPTARRSCMSAAVIRASAASIAWADAACSARRRATSPRALAAASSSRDA